MYKVVNSFISRGKQYFVVETNSGVSVIDKIELDKLRKAGMLK